MRIKGFWWVFLVTGYCNHADAASDEWKKFYLNTEKSYCAPTQDGAPKTRAPHPEYCDVLAFNEQVEWNGSEPPMNDNLTVRARGRLYLVPGRYLQRFRLFTGEEREFLTSDIAFVCVQPFQITEAGAAFGDPKWMKSLGCARVAAGLKAILIQPRPPKSGEAWQVRLSSENGNATVWAPQYAFTWPDGAKVMPSSR